MSTTQKPKVLLVEDHQLIVRGIQRRIQDSVDLLVADTPEQAWALYQTHRLEIELIFLDGYLKGNSDSTELLARIRASTFPGLIISIASSTEMRQRLFPCADHPDPSRPTCDGQIEKKDVAMYLTNYLSRNKPPKRSISPTPH